VKDRRQDIINASLAVLRESGYSGFTQPRVAAEAGLRQSHLTYYFPTRVDLLAGVARVAIDRQLAAVDTILGASSVRGAAKAVANVAVRHENTRVIMHLYRRRIRSRRCVSCFVNWRMVLLFAPGSCLEI
jgi:AcrR family transcriptional regulator